MNFRNGLEQLQRGARAGAGAQLAMAGPGYTLLAVDTHSGGISFGHTSPAGGGSSAATRCSSDYCQDPRITKNIIHLQALNTSEAAVQAESYEEVSRSAVYKLVYEREADTPDISGPPAPTLLL